MPQSLPHSARALHWTPIAAFIVIVGATALLIYNFAPRAGAVTTGWFEQTPATDPQVTVNRLNDVDCFTETVCVAVGEAGTVIETTNGGVSGSGDWTRIFP